MKQEQVSTFQLQLLLIGVLTVIGHFLFVPIIYKIAGKDTWLTIPIALTVGFVQVFALGTLGKKSPNKNLLEIADSLYGKVIGKIIAVIMIGFFLLAILVTLEVMGQFLKTAIMPETPAPVFDIAILVLCAYAVSKGIGAVVKSYEFLMYGLLLMGLAAHFSTYPQKDYSLLFPILEKGIYPVLLGSIPLMSIVGEAVVFGMLHPNLTPKRSLTKVYFFAAVVTAFMYLGPFTGPIATFGQDALNITYPTYTEIDNITIGILHNGKALAIMLWLAGSLGRIALFLFSSNQAIAQLLGTHNQNKILVLIVIVIMLVDRFDFPDYMNYLDFMTNIYPWISLSIGLGITLFMTITIYIKKIKTEQSND